MASNGIVFRPGRGPSFILVGLVVIVIILFYSYWGVSSKNNKLLRDVSVLQDRLRVLAARKLTADKKGSTLMSQITQLQDEKDKVIQAKDSKISEANSLMQSKVSELTKVREQEKSYQVEVEKLRRGVNSSSSDLRLLKERANQLLKKYAEVKANHSLLLEQNTKLTSERDLCRRELQKVKLDLDQQKNAQGQVPSVGNLSKRASGPTKAKQTDEGQPVDNKNIKDSEEDDEDKDNDNTESSKEEKESAEEKPVPSKGGANQEDVNKAVNVNVSSKIPSNENIKPNGSVSEVEGPLKPKSSTSSLLAKKDTLNDQESQGENKDAVDGENSQEENKDEVNDKKEGQDENKDADSDENESQEETKNKGGVNEEEDKEDEESNVYLDKEKAQQNMGLTGDMRHRLLPLPRENLETRSQNQKLTGNIDDIRKLQKLNNMDTQDTRRFNQPGMRYIPDKMEEAKKHEGEEVEEEEFDGRT